MKLVRFEDTGAIFSDSLSSVKDLEKRGFSVSNVGLGDSPFGSACVFDGVDSIIDTGSDWLPLGDLTISVWIKPYSFGGGGYGRIIDNKKLIVDTYILNNAFLFSRVSGIQGSNTFSKSIFLNQWQHLIITSTSAGVTNFYINGELNGTPDQNAGTPVAGTTNVIIGNNSGGTRTFDGLISNLIVWNKILSTDEIVSLYKNQVFDYEKNVIADFDMSSVNPVNNSFRNSGINGVGSNVVVKSDWITGLEFNGTSSKIDLGASIAPRTGDFSVSAWIKKVSSSKEERIFFCAETAVGEGGVQGINFGVNSTNGLTGYIAKNGVVKVVSGTTTINNDWNHVVFSINRDESNGLKIFLNGVEETYSGQQSPLELVGLDINPATKNAFIGVNALTSGTTYFTGLISKLKIFDCALTSLQVKDLYDKELGGRR